MPAITTGFWRRDAKPGEIWAGKMSDAASPVMYEARQAINMMTTKKYSARLVDYNNDPETTFADLQKLFRLVEDRVRTQGAADLDKSAEDVEIEIYTGGAGVARTYAGWFPITGFSVSDGAIRFQLGYCAVERAQLDVVGAFHHRRPAGALVREIVEARTKDRTYQHRMMDYNNDPATHLSDVKSLFAEAIARVK